METQKNLGMNHQNIIPLPLLLEQNAQRYEDRVALRYKEYGLWKEISWRAYAQEVSWIGCALLEAGLKKGDNVAILGENSAQWVMIDLAVQGAGGVSVGVYTTNSPEQVEYVVNHSQSRFLFAQNEEQLDKWLSFKSNAPQLQQVVLWDWRGLQNFHDPQVKAYEELKKRGTKLLQEQPNLWHDSLQKLGGDDLAMLIYTSGTTGPPKGVMLTQNNLAWIVQALWQVVPLFPSDEVLSFLPLCHIFERTFSVQAHLHYGYIVNFAEAPNTLAQNMVEISPTVGYAVPRIWEKYQSLIQVRMEDANWFKQLIYLAARKVGKLHAHDKIFQGRTSWGIRILYLLANLLVFRKLRERLGLNRMRFALTGAASIAPEVLIFFHEIGLNMLEGYGQTECGGVISLTPKDKVKPGWVGPAVPGLQLKIAADGEILVRSPGLFQGYYKDPEKTAETLIEGWLHTGDVGQLDAEGFLKITDRKKDILITAGGKNISPQYIENKLKVSPYIQDAVIIGEQRKYITGLILLDEENTIQYAQKQNIRFSTYHDLTRNTEITRLIQQEVNQTNQRLSQIEKVKKFKILPKRLYLEDGELTPTMKVKRKIIYKNYQDLIEAMY